MAQQIINNGTFDNDPSAEKIRTAFDKTNDNFTELYGGFNTQVYKKISTNTTLDDTYHNAVIWVTATCNITIPSGLRADFTANVRTFTGATATYLTSGTVINTESDGDVQAPKTMANISTYSTNNFIISGGGLS